MASVQLPRPSFTVTGAPGAYLDSGTGNVVAAPVIEAARRLEWAASGQHGGGANRAQRALLEELLRAVL